jgi:hypothetical protein
MASRVEAERAKLTVRASRRQQPITRHRKYGKSAYRGDLPDLPVEGPMFDPGVRRLRATLQPESCRRRQLRPAESVWRHPHHVGAQEKGES